MGFKVACSAITLQVSNEKVGQLCIKHGKANLDLNRINLGKAIPRDEFLEFSVLSPVCLNVTDAKRAQNMTLSMSHNENISTTRLYFHC